jgi:hypothetical protein
MQNCEKGKMTSCTIHPVVIAEEDDETIRRIESLGVLFENVDIDASKRSVKSGKETFTIFDTDPLQASSSSSVERKSILKRDSSYATFNSDVLQQSHKSHTSTTSSCGLKKTDSRLSFASIEIREYSRVLGDNPSATGPPISLEWEHHFEATIDIDEYEKARPARRKFSHLRMGPKYRKELLKTSLGYTDDEIEEVLRHTKKIQRSRSLTDLTSPFWRIEHLAESAKRKIKRKMKIGSKTTPFPPHGSSLQRSISITDLRDQLDDSLKSNQSSDSFEAALTF